MRHMVRNMVGTLAEVGLGRMAPEAVEQILEARDRRAAGRAAPAKGLFLQKVFYEGEGSGGSTGEQLLFASGGNGLEKPRS